MRALARTILALPLLAVLAVLTACSNSSTQPTPAANFTVTASVTTLTLAAGAEESFTVEAAATNGFNATVAVTVSGLPTGVTASPASLSLTPGVAQKVTLTAASSASAGSSTVTITGKSGSLSQSAAVALTVSAAATTADFTLSASPTSLTLTAGAAGQSVSLAAAAVNGFTGSVAVALSGLPTGVTVSPSTLTLTPGKAASLSLTAASTAAVGTFTITFTGTSGSLKHTATLALTVTAATTPPPNTAPDVTTYHYDNARDGLNTQETTLTPANVNSTQFGKLSLIAVDGRVDAQPLYLANLTVNGQNHNVLYVATEHGSLYAFDADSFTQLWKVSLIPSGQTTSDTRNCTQITPEIGITSTPVIDRDKNAIYAVTMSKDTSSAYHQWLYAINLTTGAQIQSATEIAATYPGSGANSSNGNVVFDPAQYAERTGLLLLNGNIYTAWTSHCDRSPYTGWIIGYSESTLKQTQVLNLTPNGGLGAIWMAGDGLAADSAGSIYLLDANGTFDSSQTNGLPAQGDYGNAILRLGTQSTLTVADYFESYNTISESNADKDLGSGGLILLPNLTDSSGAARQLLVGAGKDGALYLADRTNLGKYNPSTSAVNSNLYQYVPDALGAGSFSTPAYFNGTLYYGPVGEPLQAFPITQARLATSPQSKSAATFTFPGTTPSISASGTSNAIVWALESNLTSAAVLHAYDPTNLANEYYNSTQASGGRDSFGDGNKYIAPLIVNGKVYIGTQTGVAVFGLLNP